MPLRAARILCAGVALMLTLFTGCVHFKRFAYEGFSRDRWQHPDQVVASLALHPGDRVADLGSGAGYFTFRLARAVGSTGQVYAVDVDQGLNEYVAQRARDEGLGNITVVLAHYDDPLIPAPGVDLLLTCNTYHHLEQRTAYFRNVRKSLRPGARVAIIDYAGKGWFDRWFGHWTPSATIRSEMEAAGYRLQQQLDFLPRQFFLIFTVADEPTSNP
jgi:arsenite methyltransferase